MTTEDYVELPSLYYIDADGPPPLVKEMARSGVSYRLDGLSRDGLSGHGNSDHRRFSIWIPRSEVRRVARLIATLSFPRLSEKDFDQIQSCPACGATASGQVVCPDCGLSLGLGFEHAEDESDPLYRFVVENGGFE